MNVAAAFVLEGSSAAGLSGKKKQADTHSVITFVGCFLNQAPFSFNHGLSFSCVTFVSKGKKIKNLVVCGAAS